MAPIADLLALPSEVLELIAEFLWSVQRGSSTSGLTVQRLAESQAEVYHSLSIRLSCRQLNGATFRTFARTFFDSVHVDFSRASLDRLIAISDRPDLCKHVRELRLNPRWLAEPFRLEESMNRGQRAWPEALRSYRSSDRSLFDGTSQSTQASVLGYLEAERERSSLSASGKGDLLLASALANLNHLESFKLVSCRSGLRLTDMCYDRIYEETVDFDESRRTCSTHALLRLAAALGRTERPIILRKFAVSLHPGGLFDLQEDDITASQSGSALSKALWQVQNLEIRMGLVIPRVGLIVSPRFQRAIEALRIFYSSRQLQFLTLDVSTNVHVLGSRARKWDEQMLMEVILFGEPWPRLRALRFVGWHEPWTARSLAKLMSKHAATLEHVELKKTGWYQRPDNTSRQSWPQVWEALARCTKLRRLKLGLTSAGIDQEWESAEAIEDGLKGLES